MERKKQNANRKVGTVLHPIESKLHPKARKTNCPSATRAVHDSDVTDFSVFFIWPANTTPRGQSGSNSQERGVSTSKSKTKTFVSSVPFRLPTAHTNLVSLARMRHTTPPAPPLSNDTKLRTNSPGIKQIR